MMNRKKMKKIYILCFAIQSITTFGQQMPTTPVAPGYLFLSNPACAGFNGDDAYHLRLLHRNQWLGVKDAPTTQFVAIDKGMKGEKIGMGISVFNDKTHILSQQGIQMAYAYRLRLENGGRIESPNNSYTGRDWRLSFGLSGGFRNQRLDLSEAILKNPADRLLMTGKLMNHTGFEMGGGLDLLFKLDKKIRLDSFHVGISIRHFAPFSSVETPEAALQTARHVTTYMNYSRGWTHLKMEYLVLHRFSIPNSTQQLDLTALLHVKKIGFVGAGWQGDMQKSQYFRTFLGITALKNYQLMYIWGNAVNKTAALNYNTHEIGLHFIL
jgi:type IX secretion system PorP/SprF family membrane protein